MKGEKTMATFLTDIGSVITAVIGYFGDVLELFTTQPVLTIVFEIFVISCVIGLVTKLSHAR